MWFWATSDTYLAIQKEHKEFNSKGILKEEGKNSNEQFTKFQRKSFTWNALEGTCIYKFYCQTSPL